MGDSVRKYRVFIASPGDVAKERQIAREVVLSLSHRLGTYGGFVLEPVGWETHAESDMRRTFWRGLGAGLARALCALSVGSSQAEILCPLLQAGR